DPGRNNYTSLPKHGVVGVVRLGPVGEAVLNIVAANLQEILHVPVDILPARQTPEFAYSDGRKQYHAALILKKLAESRRPHTRILALVSVDLFIPVLTYVFGEAQIGGRAAVVSIHRLKQKEEGIRIPLDTFYERAAKVALHEVAHTFELVHCSQPECIMRFSSGPTDLDELPLFFCEYCEAFLEEAYRRYGIRRFPD
ncbi:MAG: archaemetzincin family Zn-dependent metalloprotease, partial [Deltaproteobacteria bacterium]